MSELLDYAEKAGEANLKFRLENAETLAKEANATLTILLAGMGGSLAFAVNGLERMDSLPSAITVGAIGLAVWLMVVACLLVVFCMLSTELQAPTNEPLNLYLPDHPLERIRVVELRNLDVRIKLATVRNHRVAAWLDRVRLMAVASPLAFVVSASVWVALLPDLAALVQVEG